jgi:RNase H-fold protein (predicted Holliday junction resolvase)
MKENFFYSNAKMCRYIRKIKKANSRATLLGLDVGRIFIGTAVSDKTLTSTKPLNTYILKSGNDLKYYPRNPEEFNLNIEFFLALEKLILEQKVKGLIIGYPLQNNQPVKNK